MEFYDVVRKRRSVRKYKKEGKIEKSAIERIAAAGAAAPSARSEHPWKFVAVTDKKRIEELAGIIGNNGKFLADASCAIIVICEDTKYYIEDGCAAVENMLLAITAEGLGACWIAGDKKDYCGAVLDFAGAPKEDKLVAVISAGIPDEEPEKEKPGIDKVLFWDRVE